MQHLIQSVLTAGGLTVITKMTFGDSSTGTTHDSAQFYTTSWEIFFKLNAPANVVKPNQEWANSGLGAICDPLSFCIQLPQLVQVI